MKPWKSQVYTPALSLYEQHYRAWTGGTRPHKFLRCSELERSLRSLIFREEVHVAREHWRVTRLSWPEYRQHYTTARYDAHATLRNNIKRD